MGSDYRTESVDAGVETVTTIATPAGPLTQRVRVFFAPLRWLRKLSPLTAAAIAAAIGYYFWTRPPWGWPPQLAAGLGFGLGFVWLLRRLGGILDDWFG